MIPFSPPHISETAVQAVAEVLRSGWITTGPRTKEFEKRLSAYCGVGTTLCVNSATAGMELVLRWFGVGPGDEVILPAYTYCATANVVRHCGATPVLVDVDADFNISVAAIKQAMSAKTKAIMPVDIGGMPCNYEAIWEVVNNHKEFTPSNDLQRQLGRVLVLADAAHSLGAKFKGRHTGNWADFTVFSFHAVKNLTTAEGGSITFNLPKEINEQKVYKYLNTLSLHGQSKDALSKLNSPGWKYDVIESGYKCNMTDIQAAIGLDQLNSYDEALEKRKQICALYAQLLGGHDWAELPLQSDNEKESSYHLFMLRVKGATEQQRDEIIDLIYGSGVSVNVHFQPLPLLTAFKDYQIEDYPVAYANYSREITLPVYVDLTEDQVHAVCAAVVNAVQNVLD